MFQFLLSLVRSVLKQVLQEGVSLYRYMMGKMKSVSTKNGCPAFFPRVKQAIISTSGSTSNRRTKEVRHLCKTFLKRSLSKNAAKTKDLATVTGTQMTVQRKLLSGLERNELMITEVGLRKRWN